MNPTEIPLFNILLNLFYNLQKYGLPLGIEDYMLALEALQGGFGIGNRQALERLCCTLWTKSEAEACLLHELLNEQLKQAPISTQESSTVETVSEKFSQKLEQNSSLNAATEPSESLDSSTPSSVEIKPPLPPSQGQQTQVKEPIAEQNLSSELPIKVDEPEQVIQAIRHNKRNNFEINYLRSKSTDEYLPVTSRQIKQIWRFLRHFVREGTSEELDVAGTVEKICRSGFFLEPVMMPNYTNKTELLLLVDQSCSMVPFHHLSRQLIEKAQQGGNITKISIYYFHNYPEKYFYTDSTQLKAKLITDVLSAINKKANVLIVGDAGAARGNYNKRRVESTRIFLEQLKQSVNYYAWLNPMPNDSWQYTTAGEIAGFTPMFEMSREGLNASVKTLRGLYVYWERPYQWMLE